MISHVLLDFLADPGYQVDSDGGVWTRFVKRGFGNGGGSETYLGTRWRKLKSERCKNGYFRVTLRVNGKFVHFSVHRLVLLAFVGPCPEGMQCRHYPDPDKGNNRLSNLSWGTPEQNGLDRVTQGNLKYGISHPAAVLTDEQAREIKTMYENGRYTQQQIADIYKVSRSSIAQIVNKKSRWKHL